MTNIQRYHETLWTYLHVFILHGQTHAFDRHAIDTVHVRPRLWNQLLCAVPEISFEVLRNQLLWGIQMAYHSSPNHHSEKNAQSIRKWTPQWRAYESITLLAHRPFFFGFLGVFASKLAEQMLQSSQVWSPKPPFADPLLELPQRIAAMHFHCDASQPRPEI